MASFIDNPQLLSAFGPYVQQLPVSSMVQVGTEKQRRYDEGIQRIQSSVDRIAGLDVIKDSHKQYLQSKLNELGTKLKTVAAGDFSNYQLTNQVAGMASSIGKDPVIQNAVYSTQKIRKGQTDMETARKEGKSSVVNEAWWNNEVNSWLNDNNINSSFDGSFVKFRDVDKKLRDVGEKVKEVTKTVDIPYRRDNQGNIIYYKKDNSGKILSSSLDPSQGVPEVDDAMLSIKTTGKSAQKILDNFYTALDEDDMRQLKMNSWYHYRDANTGTFKADAAKNYKDSKDLLSNQVVELNLELTTNKELTSSDRSSIQARINSINKKLSDGSLERDLDSQLKQIDNAVDMDNYKFKTYTQKYLTDLAKDLSYESYEQAIKSNPYFQAHMDRARLQFEYDNAARQQRNFEAQLGWDKTKFYIEQAAKDKEKETQAIVVPGAAPTKTKPPTMLDLDKDIKSKDQEIKQLTNAYTGIITDASLGTPEAKAKYLDELSTKYATDPSFTQTIKDPNIKSYLEKRRALEIERGQKQNLYKSAIKESTKFDEDIDKSLSKESGIRVGDYSYSARDLYELMSAKNKFYTKETSVMTVTGDQPVFTKGAEFDAEDFQNTYKGTKYEPLANAIAKQYSNQPLTYNERTLVDKAGQLFSKYVPIVGNVLDQKQKFQSKYIADRMPERQTAIGTLDVKNNKALAGKIDSLIGTMKYKYGTEEGLDVEAKKQFNPSVVDKLRKSDETTYTIVKKYDQGEITADVVLSLGGETQTIPLNSADFAAYFPEYARRNPIEKIKYAVLASPNKTTNMLGGKNEASAVNAYLSGYDLPLLNSTGLAGIVRVDVEGEPFNNGSSNDRFAVRMYVNDNGNWKTDLVSGNNFISEQELMEFLNNIGPTTVGDFLKKNQ